MREVEKRQPSLAQGAREWDSGGGAARGKGEGVRYVSLMRRMSCSFRTASSCGEG